MELDSLQAATSLFAEIKFFFLVYRLVIQTVYSKIVWKSNYRQYLNSQTILSTVNLQARDISTAYKK
jgi:hypothetical protein